MEPLLQNRPPAIVSALRDREALIAYARDQVKVADALVADHEAVELGLCRCGRPYPCDQRRQDIALRAHFGRIAGDAQ